MPSYRCLLPCLLFLPVFANAEDLPPLQITANRVLQAVEDVPVPVILINREQIEQSAATDAAELLSAQGLGNARNGGPGQAASVFLRGAESNHTLVLWNGVKINPATIGGAALHQLPVDFLEQVEIVKGPRSALYGSEAIGGVVHLLSHPRLRADQQQTRLFARGAAHGTEETGAGFSQAGKHWQFGAALNYLQSDGFPTRAESNLDSSHERRSGDVFALWRNRVAEVKFSHFQSSGDSAYLDFFLAPLRQDFLNSVSAAKLSYRPGPAWQSTVQLSLLRDEIEQQESSDYAHTRRKSVEWQTDYAPNEIHWLSAGVVWEQEQAASQIFGQGFDRDIDSRAFFIQDDITWDKHQILAVLRHTRHDAFGGHFTANLDYAWQWGPALRLFAGAGNGFRAPDATDRFGFGGNPDLAAEKSVHVESGFAYNISKQQSFGIQVFYSRLRDLITFYDPDGYSGEQAGQNQNIESARNKGIEANYKAQYGAWHLSALAVWQQPRNDDSGVLLARRAKCRINLQLAYQGHNWRAGLGLQAAGKRRDSDFSNTVLAGYGLVNMQAQWRLAPHWQVQANLHNLFDKDYEQAAGFNTGGRIWSLALRYGF